MELHQAKIKQGVAPLGTKPEATLSSVGTNETKVATEKDLSAKPAAALF